jgi:acyl-CoA thioester hydrolase
VRVCIDYLAEARFGSPLHVRTRAGDVGRSSLVELQAAWQGDVCVALCEVVLVHVRDGVPTPVTDALRAALPGTGGAPTTA